MSFSLQILEMKIIQYTTQARHHHGASYKQYTLTISLTNVKFNIKPKSPIQTEEEGGGIKAVSVFIQVIGFGDGKASVLQHLHFDFFRLLLGLLLQSLLLQDLFYGDLLQDAVTRLIHVLQRRQRQAVISIRRRLVTHLIYSVQTTLSCFTATDLMKMLYGAFSILDL